MAAKVVMNLDIEVSQNLGHCQKVTVVGKKTKLGAVAKPRLGIVMRGGCRRARAPGRSEPPVNSRRTR